jgi:hypothetical protein
MPIIYGSIILKADAKKAMQIFTYFSVCIRNIALEKTLIQSIMSLCFSASRKGKCLGFSLAQEPKKAKGILFSLLALIPLKEFMRQGAKKNRMFPNFCWKGK